MEPLVLEVFKYRLDALSAMVQISDDSVLKRGARPDDLLKSLPAPFL